MSETHSVSGQVFDRFGNEMSNATITLSGSQSATTLTDESGHYSISGLKDGVSFTLSATKAGQYRSFSRIVNNLGYDVTDLYLYLLPYVRVTVQARDANGKDIGGVALGMSNLALIDPPLTDADGQAELDVNIPEAGNAEVIVTPQKTGYTFSPSSITVDTKSGNQAVNFTSLPPAQLVPSIQFSAAAYDVGEGEESATILLTRGGDTAPAVSVEFRTSEFGQARERSDYAVAAGRLNFAAGETSKTFKVLITDNGLVQGSRALSLVLSNPQGGAYLGNLSSAQLLISDNDAVPSATNPLDGEQFFVRQQYSDFLSRAPDQGGFDYWTAQLAQCGQNANCLREARISVSAAFFIETEFQRTASFICRAYLVLLGRLPTYAEFVRDRAKVVGGADLSVNRRRLVFDLLSRAEFHNEYQGLLGIYFLDALVTRIKETTGFDLADQRSNVLAFEDNCRLLGPGPYQNCREAALEGALMENPAFKQAMYNRTFVLMQYFGYLRREPDPAGFDFWLNVLNTQPPNSYRGMVCGFLTSTEYQSRFAQVITHTNAECSQ